MPAFSEMISSSILRWLLPLPILGGGFILLIALLGYGTLFLAEREKVTVEDLAVLAEQETTPDRPPVGHHEVGEWDSGRPRDFSEAPALRQQAEAGTIPPVARRLPRDPLVIIPPEQQGPYGGNWSSFATSPGDMNGMTSIMYETLVRWDPLLQEFLPNLASEWSIEEDARVFTFRIRQGIRWSDGEPFTVDDILFWYNRILRNSALTPATPQVYLRGGELMKLEKIDDYTIRFEFQEPHGLFLQWVANPLMMEIGRYPAHYFRKFHPDFVDPAELERDARASGFAFWHQVFLDKTEWHNPDKPTLNAWKLTRPPPARRITFERNPYYWKVDPAGNQLPYIDTLTFEISALETMNLRFLRGDMGVQSRHVSLQNYSLLMEGRESGDYRIHRWVSTFGSGVLMPNLNHRDAVLRELMNDRRFRLALSHAIDRQEISEALYSGMGRPMQMSPVPTSPLYRDEYAEAHTEFDPEKSVRLLDALGLDRRDRRGIRLRPDGEPLRLSIEMFNLIADVETMQLVADYWSAIGIQTEVKQLARDLFYTRMPARLHDVAVGGNSNMNTPLLDHMYFVPFGLGARHALGYAAWFMSEGERGEEPPEEMKRIMEIYREIDRTADPEKQIRLGHQILKANAENLWMIGIVGDLPGIVLVNNRFRNVPDEAVIFGMAGVTAPECYAIEEERENLGKNHTSIDLSLNQE